MFKNGEGAEDCLKTGRGAEGKLLKNREGERAVCLKTGRVR